MSVKVFPPFIVYLVYLGCWCMQFTFTFSALNIGLLLYWILIKNIRSTCRYLSTILYFHLCSQFFKRIVSWREDSLWFLKGQKNNHCPDKEVLFLDQGFQKLNIVILCMLVFTFLLCKWIGTGTVCDKTLLSNKTYKYIKRKKFRAEYFLKVGVRTS